MTKLRFENKNVIVYGLGKTGLATAFALAEDGAQVLVYDRMDEDTFKNSLEGKKLCALRAVRFGYPTLSDIDHADAFFKSPGIDSEDPLVCRARSFGVPLMGDIDLLFRREPQATFIGITGTNGKSTTTALVGHILSTAGIKVSIGGNLGTPCLALPSGKDIYVLELSSYQLEIMQEARMHRAALLNVTPDHLERHGDLQAYRGVKMNIFAQQKEGDVAVCGVDQEILTDVRNCISHVQRLTVTGKQAEVSISIEGVLCDGETRIDVSTFKQLPGKHNWQNIGAAYMLTKGIVSFEQFVESVSTFKNLPHRMERVTQLANVAFYNDSKATNPDSACRALESFPNIYWIVGGQPKDEGISPCFGHLQHVNAAFVIGEETDSMADLLQQHVPTYRCYHLKDAVLAAWKVQQQEMGATERTILLSPACASWDQFDNFNHRGDVFVNAVQDISRKIEAVE